jgi:predicted DCC family thiol-disulfide oxidoreductase YuxK
MDDHPVVLFDGACAMCTSLVSWIVRHESDADLRFATLQSAPAREVLAQHGLETFDPETVYVIEGSELFLRSAAVSRLARHLRWPWRILEGTKLMPRPVRDGAYRYVAQNRYRWFGPPDACQLPPLAVRTRLLG